MTSHSDLKVRVYCVSCFEHAFALEVLRRLIWCGQVFLNLGILKFHSLCNYAKVSYEKICSLIEQY